VIGAPSGIPAPPLYGAPPPVPVHYGEVKIPPRPFAYAYGVSDNYSGANFDKKETQDEHGVVQGEYRVALPDGRTQIVTYHADHTNGYIADVKYEGVPAHPVAVPVRPAYGAPPPPPPPRYGPSPVLPAVAIGPHL